MLERSGYLVGVLNAITDPPVKCWYAKGTWPEATQIVAVLQWGDEREGTEDSYEIERQFQDRLTAGQQPLKL